MLSSSLINKWTRMMKNESVFHVNQMEGKYYISDGINGYYNNLIDKVKYTKTLDEKGIPFNIAAHGEKRERVYFPITIFQYGLGAYDYFLETGDSRYRNMMLTMANWAIKNQMPNGSWDAFGALHYICKVSSMAQGEAASLLARAFKETNNEKYKLSCQKAVDFMITKKEDGGTAENLEDGLVLLEYPDKPTVLNGWIFSAFGLLDCWKITNKEKYYFAWKRAVSALSCSLRNYDTGHWSYYDDGGKYASPFYHRLHIELLRALNKLEPNPEFEKYINKWNGNLESKIWSKIAFVAKAKQKIFERKTDEWVLVE